jgi:hypothetical protein
MGAISVQVLRARFFHLLLSAGHVASAEEDLLAIAKLGEALLAAGMHRAVEHVIARPVEIDNLR